MTRAHLRAGLAAALSCALLVGPATAVAAQGPSPSRDTAAGRIPGAAGNTAATGKPASGGTAQAIPLAPAGRPAAAQPVTGGRSAAPQAASRSTPRTCTAPATVAGLSAQQTTNARAIVRVGQQMGFSREGRVIAVATALQESKLTVDANSNVPASLSLPHQGIGDDYDSVGLFQQRPVPPYGGGGWGTPGELMDPQTSARYFYRALSGVSGWPSMSAGEAAQDVQSSAYPDAYNDDVAEAGAIVDGLPCP